MIDLAIIGFIGCMIASIYEATVTKNYAASGWALIASIWAYGAIS